MAIPPVMNFAVQPGGGLVTALRGYNALNDDLAQTQAHQLQNYYYPYAQQADIASKAAYAQFLPAQLLTQYLSNPWVQSNTNANVLDALSRQLSNQFTNPSQMGAFMPPLPQQQGGLLNRLLGRNPQSQMGGGAYPYPNNPFQIQPQGGGYQGVQSPQGPDVGAVGVPSSGGGSSMVPLPPLPGAAPMAAGTPIDQNAILARANDVPPTTTGDYHTPAAQIASKNVRPGTRGGDTPEAQAEATKEAIKTAQIGQAATANEQWKALEDAAMHDADTAKTLQNNLKTFHNAYKNSYYKGARWGTLPSTGYGAPPTLPGHDLGWEQLADKASDNMGVQLAPLMNSGHFSNQFLNMMRNLKIGRNMDPSSEQILFDSMNAGLDRIQERPSFVRAIRTEVPDSLAPDANILWNSYKNQRPEYDYEGGKVSPNNLGEKSWRDFANAAAVNSVKQTGVYKAPPGPKTITKSWVYNTQTRKLEPE